MNEQDNIRLLKLEDKVDKIDERTVRMEQSIDTLNQALRGNGISKGFVPDVLERIESLEKSTFSAKERDKIIHLAQLFEGWKLILAGALYILPIIVFIYKIITE